MGIKSHQSYKLLTISLQSSSLLLQEINRNDQNAGALLRFVYTYYPPKGKIRFGDDEMKKFFEMQHKPDQRKKVKHLLLKVIQDYHPDKVR